MSCREIRSQDLEELLEAEWVWNEIISIMSNVEFMQCIGGVEKAGNRRLPERWERVEF